MNKTAGRMPRPVSQWEAVTTYHNNDLDSPLRAIEFVTPKHGHAGDVLAFFYVDRPEHADAAKALLSTHLPAQQLMGETHAGENLVLILRSTQPAENILAALNGRGAEFVKEVVPQKVNWWKWRGMLSNVGQSLQVVSAAFKNKEGFDVSVLGFALFNLAANMINVVFGAEKRPDVHRLRALKTAFNQNLAGGLPEGESLPDPDANQTKDRTVKKTEMIGDKVTGFLRRNSVTFGEIGLRFVGSLNLAFPFPRLAREGKLAFRAAEGSVGSKLLAGAKASRNKEWPLFAAGMGWLVGKTIGLGSKIPDPYDPKPHTALDTIREKYLFKISTGFEILGAGTLMVNAFKPAKKTDTNPNGVKLFTRERKYWVPEVLKSDKFIHSDWFGGVGGLFFTTGLSTRFRAQFGTLEVNTGELTAHAAAALAKMPREQLPKLMAQSAAAIQAQLPEQNLEFGAVYAQLAAELEQYHRIPVLQPSRGHPRLSSSPPAPTAKDATDPSPASPPAVPHETPSTQINASSLVSLDRAPRLEAART